MFQNNLLEGKRIIITGASSGIGKALAYGLADLGGHVGLLSRSGNLLNEICHEITAQGHLATYAAADVTLFQDVENGIRTLIGEMGGLDVLINNAGVAQTNILPETSKEIDAIIDTNLKGTFYCTHCVLPHLLTQNQGSIINTSSALSLAPIAEYIPFNITYSATKAGINLFTVALASQMLLKHIRVNAILPGFVDTAMIQQMPRPTLERFGIMNPGELVPFYAFFAADISKQVTGRLIPTEIFKSVIHFAQKLPPENRSTWQAFEPLVKTRYANQKYRVYGDLSELMHANWKLITALLS
ncbi:MAG TPA: SDR family oxidoreductase [Candidatus Lokiarchaeia archaeon]|nr:SDR family oxidoreductase [Candidatus Lokiarchaeia archaeon]